MREYTWDFVQAIGDTIREKYLKLLDKVNEVHEELGKIHTIISNKEIASIFQTAVEGFDYPSMIITTGDFQYAGRLWIRTSSRAQFFIHERMPTNELLLIGKEDTAVIAVENFVI